MLNGVGNENGKKKKKKKINTSLYFISEYCFFGPGGA